MEQPADILFVNKPKGLTSFDVIRVLRRKLGIKKMGHAGTLDPLAKGLMIIGVGAGTKQLKDFVGLDKTYAVDVLLGVRTASGDLEGEVLEERDVSKDDIDRGAIEGALQGLTGDAELPVPIFSAVKKGGEPLYKKARRGETVEAPRRIMKIYSLELSDIQPETIEGKERVILSVTMHVGSGVYVRSIAEEIGRRLGVPATVSRLVRTQIGEYVLKDATPLEDF